MFYFENFIYFENNRSRKKMSQIFKAKTKMKDLFFQCKVYCFFAGGTTKSV